MAQSKQQIQSLLDQAGSEPRKRFGQNFMIDQNLVRLVADAGNLAKEDHVIEVGPGTGTLTEELLARAGRVTAVEIDRDLAGVLREKFSDNSSFELIEGDALDGKHALNPELLKRVNGQANVKLVANLPYNIASPLMIEMLLAGAAVLAVTVQKEVADRLSAAAGEDAYGPLSAVVQMLAKVEQLRTLPPQAFWPAPKVDSSLVRLTLNNQLGDRANEFSTFVHAIFSFRRKMLRRAMAQAGYDPEILTQLGFDPEQRSETLTPAQLRSLFERATGKR